MRNKKPFLLIGHDKAINKVYVMTPDRKTKFIVEEDKNAKKPYILVGDNKKKFTIEFNCDRDSDHNEKMFLLGENRGTNFDLEYEDYEKGEAYTPQQFQVDIRIKQREY